MAFQLPVLVVSYSDAEAFRLDYEADLSNGGIFVSTSDCVDLRARVVVRLDLRWCERCVDLPGEVVHVVPEEMSGVGGKPGVAVQFSSPAPEVREQLASFVAARASGSKPAPEKSPGEARRSARKTARVAARIEWSGGRLVGSTRNLSHSGVLIGTQDGSVPIGEDVCVVMRHPSTGEEFQVRGRVARQVTGDDRGLALGIFFEPDDAKRVDVERFVSEVLSVEHTRRLGSLSGPIAELGPYGTVKKLAGHAPRGTIVLRNGEEEGVLCFDGELLKSSRLGALRGMQALVSMLSWREGTYEFHSGLEDMGDVAPVPLEPALVEAARRIDAVARENVQTFPLLARLVRLESEDVKEPEHSKIEAALLDLAAVGFTISRALEVIPEPDYEIFRALQRLIDSKELELR